MIESLVEKNDLGQSQALPRSAFLHTTLVLFEFFRKMKAVPSGIFTQAIEVEYLQSNPASQLGKILNSKDQMLDEEIAPFAADELDLYLIENAQRAPSPQLAAGRINKQHMI